MIIICRITLIMACLYSLNGFAAIDEKQLTDPTRPPDALLTDTQHNVDGPLRVSAIFSYPSHQVAIINQQRVRVGDKIGDFSVSSISENTVELVDKDDGKQVLTLAPDVKATGSK